MSQGPLQHVPAPVDCVRLEALRCAVNEEAVAYIAIRRTFTAGRSGLLSDQSAVEVAARVADEGLDLDTDTVDDRLSYLVEHGNLATQALDAERAAHAEPVDATSAARRVAAGLWGSLEQLGQQHSCRGRAGPGRSTRAAA